MVAGLGDPGFMLADHFRRMTYKEKYRADNTERKLKEAQKKVKEAQKKVEDLETKVRHYASLLVKEREVEKQLREAALKNREAARQWKEVGLTQKARADNNRDHIQQIYASLRDEMKRAYGDETLEMVDRWIASWQEEWDKVKQENFDAHLNKVRIEHGG